MKTALTARLSASQLRKLYDELWEEGHPFSLRVADPRLPVKRVALFCVLSDIDYFLEVIGRVKV